MSFSRQRPAASCSSSGLRGRTYHRAGPPILYQVYGASGTFSATTSSNPEKGLTRCMGMGEVVLARQKPAGTCYRLLVTGYLLLVTCGRPPIGKASPVAESLVVGSASADASPRFCRNASAEADPTWTPP